MCLSTMSALISVKQDALPQFERCDACSAAMNWPWFLNPLEASFSDIRVPSAPTGSIAVIFAFRFGFDEIFRAIGFSGVVVFGVVVVVVFVVVFVVDVPPADAVVVFDLITDDVDFVVFVDLLADFVVGAWVFVVLAFDTVVFVVFVVVGLCGLMVWSAVDLFAAGLPATVVGFGAEECP